MPKGFIAKPDMYVVITRYVTPSGKVVVQGYCPRVNRSNAIYVRKRIRERINNDAVEVLLVKVVDDEEMP